MSTTLLVSVGRGGEGISPQTIKFDKEADAVTAERSIREKFQNWNIITVILRGTA